MSKQFTLTFNKSLSPEEQARLITELEVLDGVDSVVFQTNKQGRITGTAEPKYIKKAIDHMSAAPYSLRPDASSREETYYVQGMHCASCEVLIEKKLLELPGVKAAEASTKKGRVIVEYAEEKPSITALNQIFQQEKYRFSEQRDASPAISFQRKDWVKTLSIALIVIVGFLLFNRLQLGTYIAVAPGTALPMFFVFGLVAGLSSCAALVGGIVLSMSKQWNELYGTNETFTARLRPHLMFNVGRLLSYGIFGALLGALGSVFQLSLGSTAVLTILVSIIMLFLALQMLGIPYFQKFQISLPKFITRSIADEKKFHGKWMPSLMGALTFFLPCGFTLTAQSIALLSGSAVTGGLMMFFFALGTMPVLMAIGLSSVHFSGKKNWAPYFLRVAGVLLLFFSLYNVNSQLNVLGVASASDLEQTTQQKTSGLPAIVNGKQTIKMIAGAVSYEPNYFKVKAGVPVRWEIEDVGTSGCTAVLISRDLFPRDKVFLTPGTTSIKEFTAPRPGKYKFSCSMGMVTGIIEAVN